MKVDGEHATASTNCEEELQSDILTALLFGMKKLQIPKVEASEFLKVLSEVALLAYEEEENDG